MKLLGFLALPAAAVLVLGLSLGLRTLPDAEKLQADPAMQGVSLDRAMTHLQNIARRPHPMGSAEHQAVRNYLVTELQALGLDVEVQRNELIRDQGRNLTAATTQNIVARLEGAADSDKALMLMAHYDTADHSPGASDDGHAIAAILESLRVLDQRAPLQHDLIVLLTDGEERGALGVGQFVDHHRWASDVALVLNFEARGSSGRVVAFETSGTVSDLVAGMAEASPIPVADSLYSVVYQLLPNFTDFSVTREAGMPGINFAYVEGDYHYHNHLDSVDNLDPRSLLHTVSYILSLVGYFDEAPPATESIDSHSFFNSPIGGFIHYPSWVNYLLAGLVLAGLVGLFVRRSEGKSAAFEAIWGAAVFTTALILAAYLVDVLFALIGGRIFSMQPWFTVYKFWLVFALLLIGVATLGLLLQWISQGLNKRRLAVIGALALTALLLGAGSLAFKLMLIAVSLTVFVLCRVRRFTVDQLYLGGLTVWTVLGVLSTLLLPAAAHVFLWPVLICLIVQHLTRARSEPRILLLTTLAGAFGVLSLTSYSLDLTYALGQSMPVLPVLLICIAAALWWPLLEAHFRATSSMTAYIAIVGGVVILGAIRVMPPFDAEFKQPTEAFYIQDTTTGSSYWASMSEPSHQWEKQILGDAPDQRTASLIYPGVTRGLWVSDAPDLQVPAIKMDVINEQVSDGIRTVELSLKSPIGAEYVSLFINNHQAITEARLNGQPVKLPDHERPWWRWHYYALPQQGVHITFSAPIDQSMEVRVAEVNFQWPDRMPDSALSQRTDEVIPKPGSLSDTTVVVSNHLIGQAATTASIQ